MLLVSSPLFAIDVAAYAVMSNHYHIVVRIDRERALEWSVEEVLRRWTALFTGPLLVTRYLSASRAEMSQAEVAEVEALAEVYRARLHDLSWFMRTLNEHIARRANAEDGVKGRFWEGRFKSQALLDEKALPKKARKKDTHFVWHLFHPKLSSFPTPRSRSQEICHDRPPLGSCLA